MNQIYLDNLKIHDLTDQTVLYLVSGPVDGLGLASVREASYERAGEDGVRVSAQRLGSRVLSITGTIYRTSSVAQFRAARQALAAACAPTRDADGNLEAKVLKLVDGDGTAFRMLVYIRKLDMSREYNHYAPFLLELTAASPYVEVFDASTETANSLTRGGFILPAILPVVLDAGSGGYVTVSIGGDAPAWPVITFNGPLTNPRITNATTGEYFAATITLASGDTLVVDMSAKTVLQGGVTNRLSTKVAGSTFFPLAVGINILGLSTSSTGDTGDMDIVWRDAYHSI